MFQGGISKKCEMSNSKNYLLHKFDDISVKKIKKTLRDTFFRAFEIN